MLADRSSIAAASFRDRQVDGPNRVCLGISPAELRKHYDRVPFEFPQHLHTLELFQPDSLRHICKTFSTSNRGYYVAGGAASAGAAFFSVPSTGGMKPSEALDRLDSLPLRILLKRPEDQDIRFRALLDALLQEIAGLRGGFGREHVCQLESAILITSASTITPIHFDPVVGFFAQIEGEKIYHVYSPADTKEPELERFYVRGVFEIGHVKLEHRDATREYVFHLHPGDGFHQPQNAPHWVETGSGRSVSYTFVYQTNLTRALGRTRAFNHCQRIMGMQPAAPGVYPYRDSMKADVMLPVILGRKAARRAWSTAKKAMPRKPFLGGRGPVPT